MNKTIIIIPTHNEKGNVLAIGKEILSKKNPARNFDLHILFVDDASTDGTREEFLELAHLFPGQIFTLLREAKNGLGKAYIAGFEWACARGYHIIGQMDADFSHRVEDLELLLQQLMLPDHGPDAVIGSRYIGGGSTRNWHVLRRAISRFGSLYARTILRVPLNDLTGGFNIWKQDTLKRAQFRTIKSEGYSFQVELKFRAHLSGARLKEVPILFVERREGHSKMSGKIVIEAALRVWQFAFSRRRTKATLLGAARSTALT